MADSFVCPHCGVESLFATAFCQSCGKALPSAQPSGPRIIGANEFAATASGKKLQIGELERQLKRASGALLAVAIIQTVVAMIAFAAAQAVSNRASLETGPGPEAAQKVLMVLTIVGCGVAAAFFCLYSWSQSQPLAAAIVGLVVYGTLIALNVFVAVSQASRQSGLNGSTGMRGIGVGWMDLVIIGILIRAISAGSAHHRLLRANAADSSSGITTADTALQ
jgi:hypothetical protein